MLLVLCGHAFAHFWAVPRAEPRCDPIAPDLPECTAPICSGSTLRDSSSTWDGGIAKATAVETALERYRKRNEERMTAMGNAQQLAAKEAQTLRAHLTEKTIELRKDLEARIKAEEMDRTRAFLLRAVC